MSEYQEISDVSEIDPDSLEDHSPEQVAQALFQGAPKDPCSNVILSYQEGTDLTSIFEILVTILLEGLNIFSGGIDEIELENFTSSHIIGVNPYFYSMGFKIFVEIGDEDDLNFYHEYHCRIILNNESHLKYFFVQNNINKNYHFLLNGYNLEKNQNKKYLNQIYAIFACNNKVYKIYFDRYIPPNLYQPEKLI